MLSSPRLKTISAMLLCLGVWCTTATHAEAAPSGKDSLQTLERSNLKDTKILPDTPALPPLPTLQPLPMPYSAPAVDYNAAVSADINTGEVFSSALTTVWSQQAKTALIRTVVTTGKLKGAVLLGRVHQENGQDTQVATAENLLVEFIDMERRTRNYHIRAIGLIKAKAFRDVLNQPTQTTEHVVEVIFLNPVDFDKRGFK